MSQKPPEPVPVEEPPPEPEKAEYELPVFLSCLHSFSLNTSSLCHGSR